MAEETNNRQIIELVRKFLRLLQQYHIDFREVYIFGSQVNGTANEESDIDVAIVADDWSPDIIEAQFVLLKIASLIDTRIEAHPFRTNEFDLSHPLARDIIQKGKRIFYRKHQQQLI